MVSFAVQKLHFICESVPRQVDKKSRIPEEKGSGALKEEMGSGIFKEEERINFFPLHSFTSISSVAQSCLTFCDPMDCNTSGLPVHHPFPEFLKLMFTESVMPSNHFILCQPLLLPPSIFPNIRVFSNESVLHIRWPKY